MRLHDLFSYTGIAAKPFVHYTETKGVNAFMKRILDCHASDFAKMSARELLASIASSEGRVIACESIGSFMPMLGDITNAEFVSAMGADILLLNLFDVKKPVINALPECAPEDTVRMIKKLTGRPVGINLEPIEEEIAGQYEGMWAMTGGRVATLENAKRAKEMGVDMILLTGNPGMGVKNAAIISTLKLYKKELGDSMILAAGKMHAAGVLTEGAENIITEDDVRAFVDAGADIILLPAPGTVPGITLEYVRGLVSCAHSLGALTITLEQAMRFLTDYLNGDSYYKIAYPDHNFVRARAQIALHRSMEEKRGEMEKITRR